MKEKYEGFKSKEEQSFPNIINVCLTRGQCPCECVHCPLGSTKKDERYEKFGNNNMELDLFKKLVDEVAKYKHSTLRLHGVGEPLMWRDLNEGIRYANEKGIRTWLFTSLVSNNKNLIDAIAEHCSIIEVSINSKDKENYNKTKGIDKFELVNENIKYLADVIKKNNFNTRLVVSRVGSKDKEYEKKFIEFWQESKIVDDAFIRSYHSYNGIMEEDKDKKVREVVPCQVHWKRFNIDCNGEVPVCFNELFKGICVDEKLLLGNVNGETIKEIWQGEKLKMIRRAQLEGDYSLSETTKNLCCLNCKYCAPLGASKVTSEHQIQELGGTND